LAQTATDINGEAVIIV